MVEIIPGVRVYDLKIIPTENGFVRHGIKNTDSDYNKFGEMYFSVVKSGRINGWKLHKTNSCNIIVTCGEILFYFKLAAKGSKITELVAGPETRHVRIAIDPGVYFAFRGLGKGSSVLLNFMNGLHDRHETESIKFQDI